MLCRNPYVSRNGAFGCGQCLPCRINRRRLWTHRIMLEAALHSQNTFLTLTYNDLWLPRLSSSMKGNLSPKDLRNWLKRFRTALAPHRLRFYAVGEYGPMTFRPHYHVVLFGVPGCSRGETLRHFATGERLWFDCCDNCRLVGSTWNRGIVDLKKVTPEAAAYICEYTVKKMTAKTDFRLEGRHPEFSRMSLKPGLGADYMHVFGKKVREHGIAIRDDVPTALRHGSRVLPLGRYLTRKLRARLGRDPGAPQAVLDRASEEMSLVRQAAFNDGVPVKDALISLDEGRAAQIAGRQALIRGRKL